MMALGGSGEAGDLEEIVLGGVGRRASGRGADRWTDRDPGSME